MPIFTAGGSDGALSRLAAVAAVAVLGIAGSAHSDRHTVRPGETLSDIAREYGSSITDLVSANGLDDADLIVAGATLVIPAVGAALRTHTVAAGENLASIAARYGSTVPALASANGIIDPNRVRIGQHLIITAPGAGGGAGATASGAVAPSGTAGTHKVTAGETLASIASRYGVPVADLAAANGIVEPFTVYNGTRLALGGGGSAGTLARCPVEGASFFNDWGFPRSGGRYHEGNDLFAPRGTPVLAPAAGSLSQVTGLIGGRQFRLTADDGTLYLGSHLDAFGARGRVGAGDIVGYVGDSGNARGSRPHVHFEVHPDGGAAVNPYPAVVTACR